MHQLSSILAHFFCTNGSSTVFFLLICKLTVALGTLSGLVFSILLESTTTSCYQWNQQMYSQSSLHGLTLTFDIDTCFCNGLDAYSNTWLQFVFPVYIWLLVGLMILVSHYLQSFANLLGNNRVSVLATLILLPYAKILHTLITFVSFTSLEYPDSHHRKWVWVYDANIDYLVGKHIPLFLVAVLVFFLFLTLSCFSLISGCRLYHN